MIPAGELNCLITLQIKAETKGLIGEPKEEWKDYLTLWSKKEGLTDREYLEVGKLQNRYEVKYTIRKRDNLKRKDIVQKMRVIDRDEVYNIISAVAGYQDQTIVIRAEQSG